METITIRFELGWCINPNPGNGLEHLDGHQLTRTILEPFSRHGRGVGQMPEILVVSKAGET